MTQISYMQVVTATNLVITLDDVTYRKVMFSCAIWHT